MAGWTTNRQAKRPPQRRRAELDATLTGSERSADESLTLDALLAARRELNDEPQPLSRPRAGPQEQLTRLVEAEIIPRLMLLHRPPPLAACPAAPVFAPTQAHVTTLSTLAVHDDAQAAVLYVHSLVELGATHEQVLLDLLAASARHLGVMWEEDFYSFSEVTIGLWRLQRVLHDFAHLEPPPLTGVAAGRRCLLAAVPGTQHTFGLAIVTEFFMRGGWEVDSHPQASWEALRAQVAREHFDVFGLSISSGECIAEIVSGILDTRRTAANPRLFVMVGGPMAALMPDLAQRCGADAMASDASTAVALANASLPSRVRGV
ncbi:cobalamin B12-binding domain-containing protein [Roseateles amylovorans]|uniref:Cobalamin B12-binding domain-containing protein n=1 Tax=Roseateles amylovorans TaxID=2978473 RepID=A0ABY6AZG4_9BURK|nr:cobalamin B12-binding domain-containing protein [Roseateles amylovorans]UXH78566.1 cobalamin B12-binding domain-containing protein [Roseateles amylovorans]